MRKNVLIIFGGRSCEHDISIVSTFQTLKSFDEYLYNIYLVYIDIKGDWRIIKSRSLEGFLSERITAKIVQLGINDNVLYVKHKSTKMKKYCNIDIAFPILHGVNGEDGSIAGLLALSRIPYVGCNNVSSAIGIDKSVFKKVCDDIDVLKSKTITFDDLLDEKLPDSVEKEIGFPCIIKPSRLGSSIGINCCENKENLINLLKKSLNFDKKIIIEPYIADLREFNVALFSSGGEYIFSEIEEPFHNENILSFYDKYLNFSSQNTFKNIPAKINKNIKESIFKMAKTCYIQCGCSGVVRVDFIYDKRNKKLYLNEINTIPGALALYLFEESGINKKEVINMLIKEAFRVFESEKNLQLTFNSGVLNNKNLSKFNK